VAVRFGQRWTRNSESKEALGDHEQKLRLPVCSLNFLCLTIKLKIGSKEQRDLYSFLTNSLIIMDWCL